MSGGSHRQRFAQTLPLPGVDELESMARGLFGSIRAAGVEQDQFESLARRIDRLISIAGAGRHCDGITEIYGQLHNIKARFEAIKNHKSRLRILTAENRLRESENLCRELSDLVAEAQLQLRISDSDRAFEDGLNIIDPCSILYDEDQPAWTKSSHSLGREAEHCVSEHGPAFTSQTGRLGRRRVVHKSFVSYSRRAEVYNRAKEELKVMSNIHHRNIASFLGATKGYGGVNGFVLAVEGARLVEFLAQDLISGGALALLLKGLDAAYDFVRANGLGMHDEDDLTVMLNGHVTLLPTRDSKLVGIYNFACAENPVVDQAAEVYWNLSSYRELCRDQGQHFLESLASLGQSHLTELELFKIAADCQARPLTRRHVWYECGVPSFTICSGDIGYRPTPEAEESAWEVVDVCNDSCKEYDSSPAEACMCDNCRWQSLPGTHPNYCSVDLSEDTTAHVGGVDRARWEGILERSRRVSKTTGIGLDCMSFVSGLDYSVKIKQDSSSKQITSRDRLYFHRSSLSRSSPRDFWGFFSTNTDPCAPSTGLEELGWTFEYQIEYYVIDVKEDWGRKYQQALQAGLASIPGAYPEVYVEEPSDDEPQ